MRRDALESGEEHGICLRLVKTDEAKADRASRPVTQLERLPPARLSFSRALTEARVFLRRVAGAALAAARKACQEFVQQCARYVITVKPGRSFPRDRQEYRANARGLRQKPRGRPRKPTEPYALENSMPETLTSQKGETYALS